MSKKTAKFDPDFEALQVQGTSRHFEALRGTCEIIVYFPPEKETTRPRNKQQVFRWFREKHNLKGHIEAVEYLDETPDTYHWCVFDKFNSGYDQLTYEEAELECLKKLIEICRELK